MDYLLVVQDFVRTPRGSGFRANQQTGIGKVIADFKERSRTASDLASYRPGTSGFHRLDQRCVYLLVAMQLALQARIMGVTNQIESERPSKHPGERYQ